MAIGQCRDVENGETNSLEDLEQPFIKQEKIIVVDYEDGNNGSIGMVLISTFVAVCGSFEFGSCVGYSAPTQSAISQDLNLSLAQFSMFGSILTIGAMLGAITSGRIADFLGRKGAMRMSATFCITGWLAIYFSKGALSLDIGRFLTGCGIGVFSYVVPIFISEIAPKNLRGGLTTLNQLKDIENGGINRPEELEQPFIQPQRVVAHENGDSDNTIKNGSIGMVLLSTGIAVCGSFQFGICYSMFGSILSIGAVLGAFTSGKSAETMGRKGAMRVSSVICTVGWLAVYFSHVYDRMLLDIGRFLTGYGISLFSYVVPVFIAEIAPKNLRGGLATLNQLFIILGGSFTFIVGTIISWRTLALIAILPCIILVLGQWFIPESPRWLAKAGREEEFEVALQMLHGKNADVSDEKAEIQEYILTLQSLPKANIVDLFQKRCIRSVIIGVGLMVLQQFAGINGVQFYASETFEAAGFAGSIGTTAYACLQIPITLLGAFLMHKSGRRVLVMVSAAGMFIGSVVVGLSFFFEGRWFAAGLGTDTCCDWCAGLRCIFFDWYGSRPWVIMSEIFPLDVKGVGGSLVVLVNWSGAWVVSHTYNFLMNWSSSGTYYLYGAVCILTILFVAKLIPETKGKTLEEIRGENI